MKASIKGLEVSTPIPLTLAAEEIIEACFNFFEEGAVAMVECHENYHRGTLLWAALAWIQQHQLDGNSGKGGKKVVYLCEKERTLSEVWQHKDLTDYAELIGKIPYRELSPFKIKEEKESHIEGVLQSFTTQRYFFEEVLAFTNKLPSGDTSPLQDTIIIVDDAHALDYEVREAAGFSLSLCFIESLMQELGEDSLTSPAVVAQAMVLIESLKKYFFRDLIPHNGNENDYSLSLWDLHALLQRANLKDFDYSSLIQNFKNPKMLKVLVFIGRMLDALPSDMSVETAQSFDSKFRLYATNIVSEGQHADQCLQISCKSIIFVCLDASVVIRRMMDLNPHSVVLTSSSLPFKYLQEELGLKEVKELSGKSSVEDHQLFARILTCGAGGYYFNSSYNRRYDDDYLSSLGKTVLELARVTPSGEGIIIYFPSYEFLDKCEANWKSSMLKRQYIWEEINDFKEMVKVTKGDYFGEFLLKELDATKQSKGSCILAVLRSQESDYTFLPIERRRVVIIVGVPFIPETCPKIKLKKQYNRNRNHVHGDIRSGSEFIQRESYKAIRQVIDSQIRSMSDYSIILLLDTRYEVNLLSPWLSPKIIKEKRFVELLQELQDFFSLVENRILYMKDKSENVTQSSTQFGKVPRWEMEKLCMEYKRLRRNNENRQRLKEQYERDLEKVENLQKELEKKLNTYVSPLKRPYPDG